MPLQSFTQCPSCESEIALRKVRPGVFGCPHCRAEFRHNYRRWAVAIPVMLIVTLCLYYFLPGLGIWIVAGGAVITSTIIGRTPEFLVDRPGQSIEPQVRTPQQRESTFFKTAMICFFLIAMGALGCSLVYLIKFLLR